MILMKHLHQNAKFHEIQRFPHPSSSRKAPLRRNSTCSVLSLEESQVKISGGKDELCLRISDDEEGATDYSDKSFVRH